MSKKHTQSLSIILPAKNEAEGLCRLLPELLSLYPDAEILVIDDGSTDATGQVCNDNGVRRVVHPYAKGNGAAVKTGAREATGDILVCMDADGQHSPSEINVLLDKIEKGYDLAVGARSKDAQSSWGRWLANTIYNRIASWMVGQPVADLTSGFRASKTALFQEFVHMLPNGFSYPTTSTMAFFHAGYSVGYVPVDVQNRSGNTESHIRLFRDGARFFLIIFRIGTLYSPLKLFLPISLLFFVSGALYYLYTFTTEGRFTNGTGLLLTTSILVFLIGLVSEQITHLLYSSRPDVDNH